MVLLTRISSCALGAVTVTGKRRYQARCYVMDQTSESYPHHPVAPRSPPRDEKATAKKRAASVLSHVALNEVKRKKVIF
jgi:hypothetical protein